MNKPFHSIYSHGFIRAAVCVPHVRIADPQFNVKRTIFLVQQASELNVSIALFPELGISAYSNDDLFHQDTLLSASKEALVYLIDQSRTMTPVVLVGLPLRLENKLFNCAAIVYQGKLLGLIPKTYIPSYREFYEKRQFASARDAIYQEVELFSQTVPFGNDMIIVANNIEGLAIHAEICEDLWTPIPPSIYAALAGATILTNLSASNIIIGKADYRRTLCSSQSAKCIAAYLYSASGPGESTTDLAWDGHAMIYENGTCLAESERFPTSEQMIVADIDLERLVQDRMRMTSFSDMVADYRTQLRQMRQISFEFQLPEPDKKIPLIRQVERFPYVPSNPALRNERCAEVYNIQVHGLFKRLTSARFEKVVVGISGGLDSTQALIVAAKTMDRLGLPRQNILAYTMPGFATSRKTLHNAHALMRALGVTAHEIDIRPSAHQMLRDIGHPFADEEEVYDITFENVQAGERTSHLFRLANYNHAIVLGTGDLSELALGWATYGVGDQMSHYNVNASAPKTLIQYLIRWIIDTEQFDVETGRILQAILDTEISPELLPAGEGEETQQPAQSTEARIGPYELQDFHLYYTSRFGFRPSKVAFLSHHAWSDKTKGDWSDLLPSHKRNEYDLATIKNWLEVFLFRFFKISQFKRSAIPNGPKVGSGGSLSPRGDWRAPSDSEAVVWLEELRDNVPDW